MKATDIIIHKRDKEELSKEEVDFFIQGFTNGSIPDYQAAALAMAILLNGMTDRETTDLTMAMAHSGDVLDLTGIVKLAVDKHSTGGVGDKTTLVVEPLVASCGLPMGKMSGRGLGFSGGTLDKLESISGYRVNLTTEEFLTQLKEHGIVLAGQSGDLAPADGKLYALRDVTGTVPSMALIASSIMSKKIAGGAQRMVLDVKVGCGAFMETVEDATALSKLMVSIAKLSGRRAICLLSDMNQPLGHAVGNALEVKEAIGTLQGKGPRDFYEHCIEVASQLLLLGEMGKTIDETRHLAESKIRSGEGFEKLRELVSLQGGDVDQVDHPEKLPQAEFEEMVLSPHYGWLSTIEAREIGEAAVDLGAGRATKEDAIDHAVGFVIHHKVGDRVGIGEPLFSVHANDKKKLEIAKARVLAAHQWNDQPCPRLPLFYDIISD